MQSSNIKSSMEKTIPGREKVDSTGELSHPDISDAERLHQLGLEDQLERNFSLPALIALCICLMGTWEACSTVIAQALTNGGAPCLWYNFLLTFLCSIAIGASLGEIASIYPTAGGQYHWVTALAPNAWKKTTAWITGWVSIGGQVVLTASAAFLASQIVRGLIIMNNPSYDGPRWQTMLIYWAFLVYAALMNIFGHKILPAANLVAGALHVFGFVAVFVVLAVMAHKNNASYVFTETYNASGWENDAVSWLVGLIGTLYPFLGYDATCHLAEELPHASRNVPLAMVGSIVANGLIGLAYCTMLLYSTGELESLLATPTGLPFIQIYPDATSSSVGTTFMALVSILTAIGAAFAGVTSTSRTLWAFARDDATPVHEWLGSVGKYSKVPVNAVVVVVVLDMLLGLIYLGNSTAFNAILSMAIIGMYSSYLMPIICMLFHGRRRLRSYEYGPFKLGRWLGPLLNIVSVLWGIISIVFSTFPSGLPVTTQNMNYSLVVMAGWTVFGVIYYAFRGRKKFQMPVIEASVVRGFVRRFLNNMIIGRAMLRIFWRMMGNDVLSQIKYDNHPELKKLKPWYSVFWIGSGLSIINYNTSFFDMVRNGQIRVHVENINHMEPGKAVLKSGKTLKADAMVCSTGWRKESSLKFAGLEKAGLGLPLSGKSQLELNKEFDAKILKQFPILKKQPQLRFQPGPTEPLRYYRFIVPPAMLNKRNIAFAGMISSVSTAICATVQGVWISAYLDGKLEREAKSEEEVTQEAMLHTQWGKWRYPCGYGASLPDFIFEGIAYADMLLKDMGLENHRKPTLYKELTQAYTPFDYYGVVDEWKKKLGVETRDS